MEVASPLAFQSAGTKRSFMCSPPAMDVSDDYVQAKRRRFGEPSSPLHASSFNSSPFANSTNTARLGGGKSSFQSRSRLNPTWRSHAPGFRCFFRSSSFRSDKYIVFVTSWDSRLACRRGVPNLWSAMPSPYPTHIPLTNVILILQQAPAREADPRTGQLSILTMRSKRPKLHL